MSKPLVSINLVVHNGERYIKACLERVRAQSYPYIEVAIFDNASTDATRDIAKKEFPSYRLIEYSKNIGMWPGQEMTLAASKGAYLLALSCDVMLDGDFISRAVDACERDPSIGALQGKFYQYQYADLGSGKELGTEKIIDTCGFHITRSRRVLNRGHGQYDAGQLDTSKEIFAVEGAAPFFRKSALEGIRIDGEIADHDYFWYGDDLDITWRMRLFGWKQWYASEAIAYHDRSTTKSSGPLLPWGQRLRQRRNIPIMKRRWDWSNVRFTIIKNDYIINVLRDLPWIAGRELAVFTYSLLYEPSVLLEAGRFLRLLPRMVEKRKRVMSRAKVSAEKMHDWFKMKRP